MYTFCPIAPCSFFLNGRRYDIKVNEPFSVGLKEAEQLASPTFKYRKYLRLVTPLPKQEPRILNNPIKSEVKKEEEEVTTEPDTLTEKVTTEPSEVVESFVNIKEENNNTTSLDENSLKSSPKKRTRRKSNVEDQ